MRTEMSWTDRAMGIKHTLKEKEWWYELMNVLM